MVYFLSAVGSSFPEEVLFLQSRPDSAEIVARLRKERRIKLFNEGAKRWHRTDELVLGPKSGIEFILRDVEFLLVPGTPLV